MKIHGTLNPIISQRKLKPKLNYSHKILTLLTKHRLGIENSMLWCAAIHFPTLQLYKFYKTHLGPQSTIDLILTKSYRLILIK